MIKVKTRLGADSTKTLPSFSATAHNTRLPSVESFTEYVIPPPPVPSEFHRFQTNLKK